MSGSPAGSACSHVRAMRSWPAAARPITFHPLACAATPLRHQHRSRRLLLALAGPRLFSTAWPAASPAPPTPSPLRLPPPSSPRPRSPPRRHEELSLFPTPRASLPSTSFPFEPPPSYSAYLSLLLTYNRRLEWGRSRDLFLRCRSRFPLTEDVADAALLALSRLSIPQALQSFQLFLHQLRPTSPRLFNRMLALLCEHQGEEEEDGGGGEGVEGAAHLLQLMQRQGVQADAETFFHLSRLHLSASDADAAAAHYRSLSHLLPPSPSHPSSSLDPPPSPSHRSSPPPSPPPSPSPLSASEVLELFRGFLRARHLASCRLLLSDLPRFGLQVKPWMSAAVDGLQQRRKWTPSATQRRSPSAPFSLSPAPSPIIPPSPSTFRVGLERKAPVPMPDVVLPLDAVDPHPPPLPLPPPYPDHLHLLLTSSPTAAPSPLLSSLIDHYHAADVSGALNLYAHPPSPLTPHELNLILLTLTTHLPAPSPPLSFHLQVTQALAVAQQLRDEGWQVDLAVEMLILRALAYLPLPLPSSQALPSPHLRAEVVAQEADVLFTSLTGRIDPSLTSALTLLSSLHLRAQVKHPHTGTRAALSTPSPPPPHSLPYLLYHHIHLPIASLQQPYHLLFHQTPAQPPPAPLSLYFLLCGHLLRSQHAKARAIYLASALRYHHLPPLPCMTDALMLGHRGGEEKAGDEKLTEALAQVVEAMTQRTEGETGHDGGAGLQAGRQTVELWVESKVRRRVGKGKTGSGREEDGAGTWVREQRVTEALWLGLKRAEGVASLSLLLLTQLAVLLSHCALLPSLLSHIQLVLTSPPYLHAHSTESSLLSSIDFEQSLIPTLPPSIPSTSSPSPPFVIFTHFASSLSLLPFHSHTAFLAQHLFSRILRTLIYSLAPSSSPSPPPPSTIITILTLLDLIPHPHLDPLCYHILLAHAVLLSLPAPACSMLYNRGKEAVQAVELAEGGGEGEGEGVGWVAGLQHLEVLKAIDGVSRGERLRKGGEWLREGFVEDAAVLAMVDLAVCARSPPLLLSALAGLASSPPSPSPLSVPSRQPERDPRCRSFTALTSAFLQALRGVLLHHWVDTALLLPPLYRATVDYITRHYRFTSALTTSRSPAPAPSSSALRHWQRQVVALVAAVSVDTNNLHPLMSFYAEMKEGAGAEVTSAWAGKRRRSRGTGVDGGAMGIVLKAALLNGHRRKVRELLRDAKEWGIRGGRINREVEAAVRGTRFPITRRALHAHPVPTILAHYLQQVPLAPLAAQPVMPGERMRTTEAVGEGKESREDAEGGGWEESEAVRATLWACREVLKEPVVGTDQGLVLLCDTFLELFHSHVKRLRQAEALRRAREQGVGAEGEAGHGAAPISNVRVVRLIENLADDAVIALIQHATTTTPRTK